MPGRARPCVAAQWTVGAAARRAQNEGIVWRATRWEARQPGSYGYVRCKHAAGLLSAVILVRLERLEGDGWEWQLASGQWSCCAFDVVLHTLQ